MIQYQYFHTGKEYVSRLSLERSDERFRVNEKLFGAIAATLRGDFFAYAVLGGEFLMSQAYTAPGAGLYIKGLRGEFADLAGHPARYCDRLERAVSASDKSAAVLPDGRLPDLGRLQDSFSIAERLHQVFPKLFDALLYGDPQKQIVLVADSRERALDYLKVVGMLFPLSFMRKVGFCLGSANIPDEPIAAEDDDGRELRLSIRMWLPQLSRFGFDDYATSYYVFDTVADRDNYDKPLSKAARALGEVDLGNDSAARGFAAAIAGAFSRDGTVDRAALDRAAADYLFDIRRDPETARAILATGSQGGREQIFTAAALYLLNEVAPNGGLTLQDRDRIEHEYRNSASVAEATEGALYDYFVANVPALNESERTLFFGMLSRDETGERLGSYLRSSMNRFPAMVEAFGVAGGVLGEKLARAGSVRENRGLVGSIVNFFGIESCFQLIPLEQRRQGEEFFAVIAGMQDVALRKLLCAALLASAYRSDVPPACREIRIRGLKRFADLVHLPPLELLEFLLDVRNKILEIGDEFPDFEPEGDFDFLLDCEVGKNWIRTLLNSLSVSDLLDADYDVRSHSAERRRYESLQELVRRKLLNVRYVRSNVRSGTREREKYIEFFASLPADQREANGEIDEYLHEQDHEIEVNTAFMRYRYAFTLDCYRTLREEDKVRVRRGAADPLYSDEADMTDAERLRIVEDTAATFGTIPDHVRKRARIFSSIGIWAFLLGLLSFAILCIPALAISAGLGSFGLQEISEKFLHFFTAELLVIPPVTYLFDCVVYVCLKRGDRIKRANIATFVCCIIPVIVFVIAYLIFYFARLPLPAAV